MTTTSFNRLHKQPSSDVAIKLENLEDNLRSFANVVGLVREFPY